MLSQFIDNLDSFFNMASSWLWGFPLLVVLLGVHIFLTIRTRGIQRYLGTAIKISFSRETDAKGTISPFQALCVALAATIGTGNIVGVAVAIAKGGPGAVFWCWITGVLGIATKYGEALLSVHYRQTNSKGELVGGPMYVLAKGLNMRFLGWFFALATTIAAFGIGNCTQSNALAELAHKNFSLSPHISGAVMAILTALVLFGGIRKLAAVCSALVPFMAMFYIVGCVIILAMQFEFVLPAISLILQSAFSSDAVAGGFLGAAVSMAIRMGVSRGLFSNESGLGSAPIAAAAAMSKNPVRQALVSATGTFWDTVVVCALTGVVLVSTMLHNPELCKLSSSELTNAAFARIPYIGSPILTLSLATFVFSTILGWSYYGEKALEYLGSSKVVPYYRGLWVLVVYLGAISHIDLVWNFADCANAMMVFPNVISLVALSPVIVRLTRYYLWEKRLDEVSGDSLPQQ